jgi:hypothetical protein
MTIQDVLNCVNTATSIKQWTDEYRIYSPNGFVLSYCDKEGQVTSFVTNLDGAVCHLTTAGQEKLQSAIEMRMQKLKIKSIYQNPQKTK